MEAISKQEKEEMLRLAASSSLQKDMAYLTAHHRHNPVMIGGKIDLDRLIEFLSQFNEFINHEPKPFKPMIDTEMKL